ncbi:hypothetical protein [Kibdelosporangium aridum]|uniref:Uncharacterized protein n=1 Tax=Kibdelosporangium aridum TaxID=2030 RepID=A0A1Y5XS84_KIBAR|nr:hypothetical protein [Kibdelosporangium aridum]SMD14724.1 hypothetical protein SAMN05661093_05105 [Kibdelosporangium aridum]
MSELDLGLKVGARRLFWSMGLSTRLDVELRGFSPPADTGRRRKAPETYTDLDVLGIGVTGSYNLSVEIADCKTTRRDSTSRVFWLRGVADLFGADHAYLVREHDVTDAARQLATRLGVTVLPSPDLARMQDHHGPPVQDESSALAILFDRSKVADHLAAFNDLDRRLKRLLDYRQFDYWVYEQHRNPMQLVAHVAGARSHLDPRNPIHVALFLDLSWLYLLSLIRLTAHVRSAFLGDPDRGLQEYIFGGPTNLYEKQQTARLLQSVGPEDAKDLNHLPPYYSQLRELVVRLLRRPGQMQTALRYVELATAFAAARQRISLIKAFGRDQFDPVAAKLVADVCGFLVAACNLDGGFRARARAYLLAEEPPVDATGGSASSRRDASGTKAEVSVVQDGQLALDDSETRFNGRHETGSKQNAIRTPDAARNAAKPPEEGSGEEQRLH